MSLVIENPVYAKVELSGPVGSATRLYSKETVPIHIEASFLKIKVAILRLLQLQQPCSRNDVMLLNIKWQIMGTFILTQCTGPPHASTNIDMID